MRLNRDAGVLIAAKLPLSTGVNPSSGWNWAPPAFGNMASSEVSFSAHDKEVFVDFWISSDRQRQFIGTLLLIYNRPIFRTKKIKIYAQTIK
jgi:hypothetical protein